MITEHGFRFFLGHESKQVQPNGEPIDPDAWYFEPVDYNGDVVWSIDSDSFAEAERRCLALKSRGGK